MIKRNGAGGGCGHGGGGTTRGAYNSDGNRTRLDPACVIERQLAMHMQTTNVWRTRFMESFLFIRGYQLRNGRGIFCCADQKQYSIYISSSIACIRINSSCVGGGGGRSDASRIRFGPAQSDCGTATHSRINSMYFMRTPPFDTWKRSDGDLPPSFPLSTMEIK